MVFRPNWSQESEVMSKFFNLPVMILTVVVVYINTIKTIYFNFYFEQAFNRMETHIHGNKVNYQITASLC